MTSFGIEELAKASQFGATFASFMDPLPLCEVGTGVPASSMEHALQGMSVDTAFSDWKVVDTEMAECCLSGIWLLHNFLDQSHSISQSIHRSEGSYWHGIMHRREGDYSNAKYWFRKAGRHAIDEALDARLQEIDLSANDMDPQIVSFVRSGSWDRDSMVDLCQATVRGHISNEQSVRELATLEWFVLFDYCFQHAIDS